MTLLAALRTSLRRMPGRTLRLRRPRAYLAGLLVALVAGGLIAGGLARVELETGVNSFLPPDDPALAQLGEVSKSFGGDPVVVLLESDRPGALTKGGELRSLLRLEGKIAQLSDVAAVYGPATALNQVAGRTQDLLAEMSGRRDAIRNSAVAAARGSGASAADAAQAGKRATANFDRRYGAMLVRAMPAGLPTLSNQSFVNSVLYGNTGEPRAQWHFVLPCRNSVAILVRPRENIDQAATERLVERVRAAVDESTLDTSRSTVSGVPAIVSALGGEVRYQAPLIGAIALLAVAACFVLVRWTRRRDRLLPVLSSVLATAGTLAVLGWLGHPLSLGVVAFLPVLLGVGSDFMAYVQQRADVRVVFAVAVATAASFAALCLSPLPVVNDLGLTLAIGVLLAFLVAFVIRRLRGQPAAAAEPALVDPPKSSGRRNVAGRTTAGIGLVLVATAGWALLPSLPLQSDLKSFASGLPVLSQADHVEQTIGSSGELDIVLQGRDVTTPEALRWMRKVHDVVITEHGDQVRPVLSLPVLLHFLGDSPAPGEVDAAMRLLPPYLTGAVVRDDERESVMAFGVSLDDAAELQRLRTAITGSLPEPPVGFQVELTGLPVVAARGYELVSAGRYLDSTAGIVAAAIPLLVLLRRRRDALRALLTAVLATGTGLFGLWLTGTALTPVTVALGSLTAAVGCEFSVLLAEAFRRQDRALRRSVLLVATVAAIGYGVLMFSRLAAIAQFGAVLAAAMLLSLGIALAVHWMLPREAPPVRGQDEGENEQLPETALGVAR